MTDEPLPDRALDSDRTCHLCGNAIEAGVVWMAAEVGSTTAVAHAECVYRDEPRPGDHPAWQPQDLAT